MRTNFYILVPRAKHFKNNIKIVQFKKDKTRYKKVVYYYKIQFNNNIFIIKEVNKKEDLQNIKQYIKDLKLYAKITYYKRGFKKQLLNV